MRAGEVGSPAFQAISRVAVCLAAFLLAPGRAAGDEPKIAVIDLAQDFMSRSADGVPPLTSTRSQASERNLRLGGVVGVVVPLHAPRRDVSSDKSQETAFRDLEAQLSQPNGFRPGSCSTSEGIRTWIEPDGDDELARDPSKISAWAARGVRIFRVVGSFDNQLATSWRHPLPGPATGLTQRGREVVRRIYEAGGVVDVGPASSRTRDDVLAIASELHAPVVAISSNARAHSDDARNLTDSEIRAIAASGGLVAVSFDQSRIITGRTATLHLLLLQIQYLVKLAGIDHVALGTGFEGVRPPNGLEDASRFPLLANGLMGTGMSQADVERIFSRNALRLLCPPHADSGKPPGEKKVR